MRIAILLCSIFAGMVSVAQAESSVLKESEPMRLVASQMNNITAGARDVTVISHAIGTKWSYSRSTSFSITTGTGTTYAGDGIAVACCGTNTFGSVVVDPYITRLNPKYHGR